MATRLIDLGGSGSQIGRYTSQFLPFNPLVFLQTNHSEERLLTVISTVKCHRTMYSSLKPACLLNSPRSFSISLQEKPPKQTRSSLYYSGGETERGTGRRRRRGMHQLQGRRRLLQQILLLLPRLLCHSSYLKALSTNDLRAGLTLSQQEIIHFPHCWPDFMAV